ncbi:MAG TPA: hypothetical protein VHG92_04625 [Afifellaceae bacterium]|nr:hypothetical protein [Afifellaceae bacterium]
MHQAFAKTACNAALGRNWFSLSAAERDFLTLTSQINRFFVSPAALDTTLVPRGRQYKRCKFNVINFSRIRARPVKGQVTFRFISEILGEGKPYHETELFRYVASGNPIQRPWDPIVSGKRHRELLVIDAAEFEKYYDNVMALAESIKRHGFLDVELGDGPTERRLRRLHGGRKGRAVSVAIDEHGRILHHSKGHHRLAIARELAIDRIPVAVHFISGKYFRRCTGVHQLCSEQSLRSAIRDAADRAMSALEDKRCGAGTVVGAK